MVDLDCGDGCDGCDNSGDGGSSSGARGCGYSSWSWMSACSDCSDGCDWCDLLPERKPKEERHGCLPWSAHDVVDRAALSQVPDASAARPMRWWSGSRFLGVVAIRMYQRWISPRLPARCRYTPTCSAYGLAAVRSYGLITGSRLALGRIRRCTRHVPHGTSDPLRVHPDAAFA